MDKFKNFGLTPIRATKVSAPLIKECHANFECRLADGSFIVESRSEVAETGPEASEVLCLGPVYFSSFGSDFAKAR